MRVQELLESKLDYTEALKIALPVIKKSLGLTSLPKITIKNNIVYNGQPSFGQFIPMDDVVLISVANRHPNDIIRTLAHELTHYRQYLDDKLGPHSGRTGSNDENEAHAEAGKIMRILNKSHPQLLA